MRRLLAFVLLLGLLGATLRAQAGGTVADDYGMGWYVPASNLLVTYSWYGPGQTEPMVDALTYGVATVDRDSLRWRLLWDDTPDAGRVHVFFSFKGNDSTDPKCVDDVPGNCTLASTTCITWTGDGNYRMCTAYRIMLWINNMSVTAPAEERLEGITRHELAHVLGFDHGDGGPMVNGANEFNECQLAQWDVFDYDPSVSGWTKLELLECQ